MSSVYFRSIWNTSNLFIKNGAINTPSYNTVDQNNLIAEYGQIVYNSTTNTVNFFSNTGVWNPIVPTNNITIGNLNFSNNTISSTTGDIILYPNSAVVKITGALNMQTNNIINVGTINCGAITSDSITAKTTNSNLTLNGNGEGGVQINAHYIHIDNNKIDTHTSILLDGLTVTKSRQIACYQNNFYKLAFGLESSSHFFIQDKVNNRDLFQASILDGKIRFPTYSTNGILRIDSGDVTVDTIVSSNSSSLNITTTAANADSDLRIDGPATTKSKQIICRQNNLARCSFGLLGSSNFFVKDLSTIPSINLLELTLGTATRNSALKLPTYTTNGLLRIDSGTVTVDTIVSSTSTSLIIKTTAVSVDSDLNIDGATTTKSRQIICKQNNVSQCSFGLLGTSNFFVKDLSTNPTANLLELTLGTANRTSALKLPTYTSNGLLRIDSGTVTVDTNFTTSTNNINCNSITSNSTTLLLNGTGSNFANVSTNNASFLVSSTVANQESFIGINGPTTTNNRHIACYQNGTYMCSFGLAGVQYFYVSDTVAALELFKVNMGGGNNCIRFPTYSTNGILRIDSGTVTVDSNFTTGSNTINVDAIIAKTTNSNLYLHPNGTGTVLTNSPVIYIASNRVDSDSAFSIDGPTVTNSRYIACYQNGAYKLGFGLQSSNHFFIWDNVNGRDLFRASILNGNISFPTYSTNGILRIDSGTVTVDTNFTTGSNTINVNNISSISGALTISGVGGISGVIIDDYKLELKSRAPLISSYIGIDGPTITENRYIACSQNGTYRCSFGLRGTSEYYIRDIPNNKDIFRAKLDNSALCIVFPTYSTTGTLQMSAGSVVSNTSDRRLKQNEEVLTPSVSLQQILNLQPKKYRWNSDINRTQLGFIAQDVETVIPDAIDGKKYEYEFVRDGASPEVDGTVRVDEDGNPVLDYTRPRYRGLDQCAILSVLVSAFQELHNNINIKLSSIENRLTALETVINNS